MNNSAFSDYIGKYSSLRVVMAGIAIVIFGTWSYVSIATLTVQPLGIDLLGVISAILGAKIWQKHIEQKDKEVAP